MNQTINSHENKSYRKKIENYTFCLDDILGRGFTSTVFKGINNLTNQVVAIKMIDMKNKQNNEQFKMLMRQLDCLKDLDHINIIKWYNTHFTINNCYIVTEYCNEGDLARILKKKGKFRQDQFIPIFKDLLMGYKMFAEKGYIHRDLKPANLLVSNKRVKIADFGFAKKIVGTQNQSYRIGTPFYMAPEALNFYKYTQKGDIWSIGILSYELLSGSVPWDCQTQAQLKEKIAKNNIPINRLNISSDLKDLLQKCLQIDENKRYNLNQLWHHEWMKRIFEGKIQRKITLKFEIRSERVIKCKQPEQLLKNIKIENLDLNENPQKRIIKLSSLQILTKLLNICRFIYQIYQILPDSNFNNPAIISLIKKSLEQKIIFHEKLIQNKQNIIQSKDWNAFINSQQWQKYTNLIEMYSKKYKNLISANDNFSIDKINMNDYIKQILNKLQTERQIKQNQKNIILLKYLVNYNILEQIFDSTNKNFQEFCLRNEIDKLMQIKITDCINLYDEIKRQIKV